MFIFFYVIFIHSMMFQGGNNMKNLKLAISVLLIPFIISCQTPGSSNSNSPSSSASPAPITSSGNTLKVNGKEAKIGVQGKVSQQTYANVVTNVNYGGLPNGTKEGTQPGEYRGIIQIGGDMKGDITLDKIKEVNLIVQEVDKDFQTSKKAWTKRFSADTFNKEGGLKIEITAKDGKFSTVKVSAKVSPDKGQPDLTATEDIEVEFVLNKID